MRRLSERARRLNIKNLVAIRSLHDGTHIAGQPAYNKVGENSRYTAPPKQPLVNVAGYAHAAGDIPGRIDNGVADPAVIYIALMLNRSRAS